MTVRRRPENIAGRQFRVRQYLFNPLTSGLSIGVWSGMPTASRIVERQLSKISSLHTDVEQRLLYLGTGHWRRALRGP